VSLTTPHHSPNAVHDDVNDGRSSLIGLVQQWIVVKDGETIIWIMMIRVIYTIRALEGLGVNARRDTSVPSSTDEGGGGGEDDDDEDSWWSIIVNETGQREASES